MKKAIAVFSGGLDCTVAASVYAKDYEIHAITFNYGQKGFDQELKASREISEKMGFKHYVIDLDWLAEISTSSLNTSEDIPEVDFNDLDDAEKSAQTASSVWVPARNTAIELDKDEIVKLGHEVNAPMELSYSCYKGTENHCGICESCMRRKRGFQKAGIKDLTKYEK